MNQEKLAKITVYDSFHGKVKSVITTVCIKTRSIIAEIKSVALSGFLGKILGIINALMRKHLFNT